MSKNKDLWFQLGINSSQHERCDEAMALFMGAVKVAGPELARCLFREALFQLQELPNRSEELQQKASWKP